MYLTKRNAPSNVPELLFGEKLLKLMNNYEHVGLFQWTDDGESFFFDPVVFRHVRKSEPELAVLGLSSVEDFYVGLYSYGFKRVGQMQWTDNRIHFSHPDFIRGKPELLSNITFTLPSPICSDYSHIDEEVLEDKNNINIPKPSTKLVATGGKISHVSTIKTFCIEVCRLRPIFHFFIYFFIFK